MKNAKILENALPSEIQHAMGVALMKMRNANKLTLEDIAHVMGCTSAAVSTYIISPTKMAAVCWVKATARWPELHDRMIAELDEAEREAAARQRSFKLEGVA
jgi:predicted transcriptional regulator